MIKLIAGVSKKVPVEGIDFSSKSASAGVEVEVANGTTGEELRQKLGDLYGLLESAVDEQLQATTPAPEKPENTPPQARNTPRRSSNSNSRKATEAQVKAIVAIASDRGITEGKLLDLIRRKFEADSASALSVRQASKLIDILKNNGKE